MAQSTNIPPRYWWLPLAVGVAATPITIYVAVLSWGFGHGDGRADSVLFPLKSLLSPLLGEVPAENVVYFTQFPIYGVILAVACRVGKLAWASAAIILFHVVCYVAQA